MDRVSWSSQCWCVSPAVKVFSKLNQFFFGYFHPLNRFFDNKNIYFFRGDLSNISAITTTLVTSGNYGPCSSLYNQCSVQRLRHNQYRFFSKLNKIFFGYFDPLNFIFLIINTNNFRGDLTDNSVKKDSLDTT